jgi:hypothetical protein
MTTLRELMISNFTAIPLFDTNTWNTLWETCDMKFEEIDKLTQMFYKDTTCPQCWDVGGDHSNDCKLRCMTTILKQIRKIDVN